MARNIEIKARVSHLPSVADKAAALADSGPVEIAQDDSFFHCERGRLKLRAFSESEGELIFYRRDDRAGPKESFYLRSHTAEPGVLRDTLALAYGLAGRVVKARTLYLVGRTRVHLDRVQGLGDFVELEVVLQDHEAPEVGVQEAHALMARLGIDASQLVDVAYVDLLRSAGPSGGTTP
jgi:predicted adenylyl cyclase CyaB